MDIAIISEHASPACAIGGTDAGGQNVYVAHLARLLSEAGHTVDVFTRKDSHNLPLVQEIDGYNLINVPAGPASAVPKEKILTYMEDFSDFMVSFIKRRHRKYDVIHANFWMSGLVAIDIKEKLKIPFAITFHALGRVRRLHQGKDDSFPDERFAYEDKIVREADSIIAECPQDKEDLISLYSASEDKICIVPCGYDSAEMHPVNKKNARQEIGVSSEGEVILHLGRMVPRKGAENVIRGFGKYLKKEKRKSKLVIVGGETDRPDPRQTPEIGRLMEIAREENVLEHVIFTGRKSRKVLKYYYSAADVFVTTPWYEPFGITPVEAMACGTPVIGSAVGGIKYSVKHGETGLLVRPEDPHELGHAFSLIMKDKNLRDRFSRKAIQRANAFFRWETMAAKIEEILDQIASREQNSYPLNFESDIFIPMNMEGVSNAIAKSIIG